MAPTQPKIGDPVVYRGRYREVVGWQHEPAGPTLEERGPVVVYRNPDTERDTWTREEDLVWSEYLEAWHPVGLLLSREECCVYAALPTTIGNDVPQATAHPQAVRLLDGEELDLGVLDEDGLKRLDRQIVGYWPDEDTRPTREEVFEAARELREHRRSVAEAGTGEED